MKRRVAVETLCVLCAMFMTIQLTGCKSDEKSTILLTVSHELTYEVQFDETSVGFSVSRYMLVSEEGAYEQPLEFGAIDGFNYERGYEYLLKVKKIDSAISRYSFEELVSRTKTPKNIF